MGARQGNPLAGRFAAARGVFVTGTDTGVGKTVVAGALAMIARRRDLRAGVFKPIATGCHTAGDHRIGGTLLADLIGDLDTDNAAGDRRLVSTDAEFLAFCADSPFSLAQINPIRYRQPLAPLVAARRERRPVDFDALVAAYNHQAGQTDFMIVEGIGGLLVPIAEGLTVLDLAEAMALPLLIVARPVLGTVNHALLTVAAARDRGLKLAAIAVNRYRPDSPDPAEESNPAVLAELTGLPVVCVPEDSETRIEPPPAVSQSVLFACRQLPVFREK